jgi:hypothetical protein
VEFNEATNRILQLAALHQDNEYDSTRRKGSQHLDECARQTKVESAWHLLDQMMHGNGTDVPKLTPNLVTYNTLLDGCGKARDLDAALVAKYMLHPIEYKEEERRK